MSTSLRPHWTALLCDSLEKVFPDQQPRSFDDAIPLIGFRGESTSVQIAALPPYGIDAVRLGSVRIEADLPAGVEAIVSSVDLVPVEYAAAEGVDESYLRTNPGLYPDLLRPVGNASFPAVAGQWRAGWVDLRVSEEVIPGEYQIALRAIADVDDSVIASWDVTMRIPAATLPALDIPHVEWFHVDGLADYYGYEVFGEEHWNAIDKFLASAARAQINAVLTPIWTPPLDTEIGGTRTATQLIDITDVGVDSYSFDFARLRRWIDLCRSHDVRYLEMPHLFTQWGAKATPAIYVHTEDGLEHRFGWHVSATDSRYRAFLEQLLPALIQVLDEEWDLDRVLFHVSDEPTPERRETYAAAREVVADLLAGRTMIDAISDYDFYTSGLVPVPVVANDHAQPFLDAGVSPMWLYYCVAQNKLVANRFISQPSTRNRVMGAQLFATRASGFLHWGFNFYNSALSRRSIDPFRDSCAGGGFVGGDPFLVYPGPHGQPWESIRHRVTTEAFNDYRAFRAVAEKHGEEAADALANQDGALTLTNYSYDADHYRRSIAAAAELLDA